MERAFNAIATVEVKVREIEIAQPVQKLASGWVTSAVWAAAGALAMFVLKQVGVM